jgi:hypothetical protein
MHFDAIGDNGTSFPPFDQFYFSQNPVSFVFSNWYIPEPLGLGTFQSIEPTWIVISWQYRDVATDLFPRIGSEYNRMACNLFPFADFHPINIEPNNNWESDTSSLERIVANYRIAGAIFVGHGSPGNIGGLLGRDSITSHNLSAPESPQLEFLKVLGAGLPDDGSILIRMCNVSSGHQGARLLTDIADITNVRIWATPGTYGIVPWSYHEFKDPTGVHKGMVNPLNPFIRPVP